MSCIAVSKRDSGQQQSQLWDAAFAALKLEKVRDGTNLKGGGEGKEEKKKKKQDSCFDTDKKWEGLPTMFQLEFGTSELQFSTPVPFFVLSSHIHMNI